MSSQNKGDEVGKDFKSKFLSDAEVMKEQLDSVSPTMCLAKWKQVSLHLTTGKTNSCYHPPLHDIDVKPLTFHPGALHNTEQKKQARKQMLEGTRPDECSYCWNIEDEGKLSDRHYRSGEPWAAEAFKEIVDAPWDQDVIPSYVEVNFNHNCNLRCSYCSPQYSTAWEKETNEHGAWPTSTPHNDPKYFQGSRKPIPFREHNPYVEAFWEWWPDLYPELKHFRMTGGEPMMDKNTYRVFDHVLANPKPDLHLSTTSNFSVSDKLWKKYLGYVKEICSDDNVEHFMQYVSVDAFGPKAEYIRDGLDFDLLWERVNQFLTEVPERSSITFIITMNNLNVTSFGNLLAGINGLRQIYSNTYQRVWFDTPLLRTPEWQSMQILPESYCDELDLIWSWMLKWAETEETRFKGFKDYEMQRLDRDIAWMRSGQKLDAKYLAQQKADFYKFFTEHDKRRGTNFLETFPEMKSFWKECEQYAKKA